MILHIELTDDESAELTAYCNLHGLKKGATCKRWIMEKVRKERDNEQD